ncbi:MAG: hypothetical protein H0V46_00125 [Sphingomonas sp.]|nr:hypothetical protein [Sphingomonas sp.]
MRGLQRAGRAVVELYPRGLRLFLLAPAIPALVVLPEFSQHVAEIRLGMFDSIESFTALQLDATRMAFGYAKIAGLLLTILAAARFWWTREHGGHWWNLRSVAWGRLVTGAVFFIGVGSLPELAKPYLTPAMYQIVSIGWSILLLPFLFLMLAGLFGDRETSMSAMIRRAWPWLLLTAILAVLAFGPSAWLHQMNHHWAMCADRVVVWLLMLFDSLLVGLMAVLTGTAFYLGYAAFARSDRA